MHATIAGVVLGLLTPLTPFADRERFVEANEELVGQYQLGLAQDDREGEELANSALGDIEELARESQPVLDRIEHGLHPWTSFAVLPIFALANAGISLDGGMIRDAIQAPISAGVAFGLMLGKPIGIVSFAWFASKLRIGTKPHGLAWSQIWAVGAVAGIGFTMSLFIAGVSFPDAGDLAAAKLAVFGGSIVAAACGVALLWSPRRGPRQSGEYAAQEGTPV